MRGRPHEYPNADARSPRDPNEFCPKEKVIALYNKANGTKRTRMSADIEAWFEREGRSRNWVAFHFSSAGCTLIAYVIHGQDASDTADEAGDKVVSFDAEARRRGR